MMNNSKKQESISTVTNWLENDLIGPEERPWVNIKNPYWAIVYTPSFILKKPSTLFPLGVGQSEHYGYYKKASRWSSMYDPDMVEETSNFERLANGNLDFSFLVIFLLPILLIILTHNINGLEKDLKFHTIHSIEFDMASTTPIKEFKIVKRNNLTNKRIGDTI